MYDTVYLKLMFLFVDPFYDSIVHITVLHTFTSVSVSQRNI